MLSTAYAVVGLVCGLATLETEWGFATGNFKAALAVASAAGATLVLAGTVVDRCFADLAANTAHFSSLKMMAISRIRTIRSVRSSMFISFLLPRHHPQETCCHSPGGGSLLWRRVHHHWQLAIWSSATTPATLAAVVLRRCREGSRSRSVPPFLGDLGLGSLLQPDQGHQVAS